MCSNVRECAGWKELRAQRKQEAYGELGGPSMASLTGGFVTSIIILISNAVFFLVSVAAAAEGKAQRERHVSRNRLCDIRHARTHARTQAGTHARTHALTREHIYSHTHTFL